MLNALKHECPPHGGFAIGLDRLLYILRNRYSIRDVIAFPKTIVGSDLLTGSPCRISDDLWKEVGLLSVCYKQVIQNLCHHLLKLQQPQQEQFQLQHPP